MAPAGDNPTLFESPTNRLHFASEKADVQSTFIPGVLNDKQNKIILIVSLTCASTSLLITSAAFRWFFRMRRSFRHRLIVLLILGDLAKALAYSVFPIVTFVHGPISTSSPFCQVSGFFLSVGIEAADVAILAIAVHATLYVFRPPKHAGKGGLYNYRRAVYAAYMVWPALSTSIAFTNHDGAFANFQIYCTYPKRPFWYRLALSWVPRYMIFFVVICLYITIYAYVKIKFQGFDNLESHTGSVSLARDICTEESRNRLSSPADGESSEIADSSNAAGSRKVSVVSSLLSKRNSKVEENQQRAPEWEQVDFITAPQVSNDLLEDSCVSSSDFAMEASSSKSVDAKSPTQSGLGAAADGEKPMRPSLPRTVSEARTIDTECDLDYGTTTSENNTGPSSLPRVGRLGSQAARTRRAIKRQLRFMFMYPLTYILMWTLPFINHCFNYNNWWVAHTPFSLTVASTACLGLQAAVDSLVFSWREKPWRRRQVPVSDLIWRLVNPWLKVMERIRDLKSWQDVTNEQTDGSRPKLTGRRFSSKGESTKSEKHWWEVEGRKRKDSIWMGTDSMFSIPRLSRGSKESHGPSAAQTDSTEQTSWKHSRSYSSGWKKPTHIRSQSSKSQITAGKELLKVNEAPESPPPAITPTTRQPVSNDSD